MFSGSEDETAAEREPGGKEGPPLKFYSLLITMKKRETR